MDITQQLYQEQKQQMQLRLSPQQLLTVKLLELPVAELAENVRNEIVDNVALDEGLLPPSDIPSQDEGTTEEETGSQDEYEAPDSLAGLDDDGDDDMPSASSGEARQQDIPIGATRSFIDDLMDQTINYNLTHQQLNIIEYLIGSLDNHGFITCSSYDIVDDLMIHHNLYVTEEEVDEVLHILQQFDPPGIAAHDVRESLLLQIDHKLQDANHLPFERIELLQTARTLIDRYYDLFSLNNLEKLQNKMDISSVHLSDVLATIRELNLYPGQALCESSGDRVQLALPDFVVETDTDGNISFSLNGGDVPSLHVNQEYVQMLRMMQQPGIHLSKQDKERATYFQQKVDAARMYIESIRQRQRTLEQTMRAIIHLQHDFFLTQDEADIRKLILEDVAKRAGVDISTVSRVCNSKYALVDGTLYPLSFFFKRVRTNKEGEEVDSHKVETLLKQIIDEEDKRHPLSDGALSEALKKHDINISRRTVNKYRDSLGIPTALQRKSI